MWDIKDKFLELQRIVNCEEPWSHTTPRRRQWLKVMMFCYVPPAANCKICAASIQDIGDHGSSKLTSDPWQFFLLLLKLLPSIHTKFSFPYLTNPVCSSRRGNIAWRSPEFPSVRCYYRTQSVGRRGFIPLPRLIARKWM